MKKIVTGMMICCLALTIFAGCNGKEKLDPKNPVSISMRHNFGGAMRRTMDILIDEFNATVGSERGVVVNLEATAPSANLDEISPEDPIAQRIPDISASYPKTAVQFEAKGLLANLDDYFSAEELAAYLPASIAAGRLGNGGLYLFPFAMTTELLLVNTTLFDSFSEATGVTMDCFQTFEGIADAAMQYYEWTNRRTADIPRDHRQFFSADSYFNLAQAGMIQQGARLFSQETLTLNTPPYKRIWETFYAPSVKGGVTLYDGASLDLFKTGDIISYTASSEEILFYGNRDASPDNRDERAQRRILPYPVFEGGEKIAILEGAGFMVAKSDAQRETAAALFLKWLSSPERNTRIIAETGYLPAAKEAFETSQRIPAAENPSIKQALETVRKMYGEYDFFTPPSFEGFDDVSREYKKRYQETLLQNREAYLNGGGGLNPEEALDAFMTKLNR